MTRWEKTFVLSVPFLTEGSKRCPCSQNGYIRKGSNELDAQKVFSQAPFGWEEKKKSLTSGALEEVLKPIQCLTFYCFMRVTNSGRNHGSGFKLYLGSALIAQQHV